MPIVNLKQVTIDEKAVALVPEEFAREHEVILFAPGAGGEFYAGQGCNTCSFTGFSGRIGVYEVLAITEEIRSLIIRRTTATKIKSQAIKQGMVTIRRGGMLKIRKD